MGHLSNLFWNNRGPRPRSNGSDGGPLRLVVETWHVGDFRMERYECGHEAQAKRDLMGYTNAARRRCRQCKIAARKGTE